MANNRAKAALYRQSDKGRMARKLYNQRPEVKAHKATIYQLKKKLGIGRPR